MKISELGKNELCQFLRIDMAYLSAEDEAILDISKAAAIAYVSSYTGISMSNLNMYADITIAVLVLISDMFDNRQMVVDKNNVNRVVSSILDMHCMNLLG